MSFLAEEVLAEEDLSLRGEGRDRRERTVRQGFRGRRKKNGTARLEGFQNWSQPFCWLHGTPHHSPQKFHPPDPDHRAEVPKPALCNTAISFNVLLFASEPHSRTIT